MSVRSTTTSRVKTSVYLDLGFATEWRVGVHWTLAGVSLPPLRTPHTSSHVFLCVPSTKVVGAPSVLKHNFPPEIVPPDTCVH